MKKAWLWVLLLAAALPARADEGPEDVAEGQAEDGQFAVSDEIKASANLPACAGEACPATVVENILYGYGTACSGLDWRFLKQVAQAESGLNPKNHTGKYVGLFQMGKDGCAENLGSFKSFLTCGDLEDPEVNTAVAAARFDRYFRGGRGYPSILKTCPGNSPAENMALAYIGHNNGPAVLKYALRRRACKDAAIRKAIRSFYENHPGSRDDGKFLDRDGRLQTCSAKYEAKYGLTGTKSFRCVNAKWGLVKYDYGRRRVAAVVGIERLYLPEVPGRTRQCPAQRMFTKTEILASLADGTFKDKPLRDKMMIAQQEARRRRAEERGASAYAGAAAAVAAWNPREQGWTMAPAVHRTGPKVGTDRPAAQLPSRFRPVSVAPPGPVQSLDSGRAFSFWGYLKSLFGL